jgi:hypothetical protein
MGLIRTGAAPNVGPRGPFCGVPDVRQVVTVIAADGALHARNLRVTQSIVYDNRRF